MIRLVILDGFNAGDLVEWNQPGAPLVLQVARPEPITTEELLSEIKLEDVDNRLVGVAGKSRTVETYKMVFASLDRTVALYSTTGNANDFIDNPFILKNYTATTNSNPEAGSEEEMRDQQ